MSVLVLSHADVERLLGMRECMDVMAAALKALANGDACQPLRHIVRAPMAPGFMGLMPAYASLPAKAGSHSAPAKAGSQSAPAKAGSHFAPAQAGSHSAWGLKVITIHPDNPKRGLDAHQGAILLFDGTTGETMAVINASAVTAVRTAAVSGVATRTLARKGASVVAVLGAGVQARSHVEAMRCAIQPTRIYLWARDFERAQTLARDLDGVTAVESCRKAVSDADVICTTTSAREPVLRREWLKPGVHVNAVGSCVPTARELDTQTMADALLVTDRRESAEHEAGDYLLARAEGANVAIAADLGEILAGTHAGRTRDDEITVFESLGLAIEDLAAAYYLYDRACEAATGTRVSF